MDEARFADAVAALLLLSALCHLGWPAQTARWMGRPAVVRGVGVVLLLAAVPWLRWGGWYGWTLFGALALSGAWRLGFPRHAIRAQERSYPRRVHGCLLLGGAALVWTLRP